tara:strand:- start:390 stop:800 length:411 start_codon:yes stop_codon:yes gene_type:complete
MVQNMKNIKGSLRPLHDQVIVSDMYFGEQKTESGLIISSDDGNVRGIYPRWGKVYAKGPENKDDYNVGDWILIEHGRWTRSIALEDDDGEEYEVRKVELESILAFSHDKPDGVMMSNSSSGDWNPDTVDAGSFIDN